MSANQSSSVAGKGSLHVELFLSEQVKPLYGGLPAALLANVLLATLLAGVQWPVIGPVAASIWLALLAAVLAVRAGLYLRHRGALVDGATCTLGQLKQFRLGAIATGVVWGMAGLLLFPADNVTHQVFLAFVLAGLSAGALASLAADRQSALGFVVPALLPLALRFAMEGGTIPLAMGLMVLMYLVFVVGSVARTRHQLHENSRLRSEVLEQDASLRRQQQLTEVITRAQSQFIREKDRRTAFDGLLSDILVLTGSEYGFIGEVLRTPAGDPYLKTYAITNIAWDEATRAFYEANAPQGMEFTNLNTLFGAALKSGEPVIANDPYHDPRRGGLPKGHPALNAFLGLPVHHGGEMVAMLGIANRAEGYDQAMIDFLQPLRISLGQLVEASRIQQQHREYQVELARLSRVASQTTNAVVITDAEGRVEWVNEGFTRISGYTLDEVAGRRPGEFLQGEDTDPATVTSMREALLRDEPFDVDVVNYSRSGQPYWVNICCNALHDAQGELQGYMAIESDISQRKRMERMKNEFISTVSHELRTPLTSLSGALGLIVGGALGALPEQARQMAEVAHKNSQRLGFLINDLLDMEKLMAGKLRFDLQVQPLMPLIEASIRDNQAYADQHGVRLALLERADAVEVEVDAQRLQQVLANLLSNAAKFSPKGGEVEVRATLHGERVRIAVTDHGPGVPDEFRDRIFHKFSQADASDSRQKGGSGLGLAISLDLVERMRGTIGFDSIAGEGACFFVDLPVHADRQSGGDRA